MGAKSLTLRQVRNQNKLKRWYQKKNKIGHDLYVLFRVPFKKTQKWVTKNQGKPDQ